MTDKTMTAAELCELLQVDIDTLRRIRRGRDATHFPPPLCGEHGLTWLEADVATWLSWWAEYQEMQASGFDPCELAPPVYQTTEPEDRRPAKTKKV